MSVRALLLGRAGRLFDPVPFDSVESLQQQFVRTQLDYRNQIPDHRHAQLQLNLDARSDRSCIDNDVHNDLQLFKLTRQNHIDSDSDKGYYTEPCVREYTDQFPVGTLLFAQFQHVFTLGRRQRSNNSAAFELRKIMPAPVVQTLRGGLTTYHGPGQLVIYPIVDLRSLRISPRCHVQMLESVLIRVCADAGLDAHTTENPGVWTDDKHKIAAVGVHVQHGITSCGVALNIDPDLAYFNHIDFCGLASKGKVNSSVFNELRRRSDIDSSSVPLPISNDDLSTSSYDNPRAVPLGGSAAAVPSEKDLSEPLLHAGLIDYDMSAILKRFAGSFLDHFLKVYNVKYTN